MQYTDHVADLSAALADTSRRRSSNNNNNTNSDSTGGDVRTALALLHADGLAQLMSYVPLTPTASADAKEKTKESRPLLQLRRTLRAVCPQLRLDAEVLCGGYFTNRRADIVGVCADAGQLWCCVRTPRSERNRRSDDDDNGDCGDLLSMCLWWARRCGLPLWVQTRSHMCDRLLSALRSWSISEGKETEKKMGRGVQRLDVDGIVGSEMSSCTRVDASVTASHNATKSCLCCVLATASDVVDLSLHFDSSNTDVSELVDSAINTTAATTTLLPYTAAHTQDGEAAQHEGREGDEERALVPSAHVTEASSALLMLQRLFLSGSARWPITTFPCMAALFTAGHRYEQLEVVRLCHYAQPHLPWRPQTCPHLRSIDLVNCACLTDLAALANAPFLQVVLVESCAQLSSLDALQSCRGLCELTVRDCPSLTALSRALFSSSGAAALTKLVVQRCDLRSLPNLATCDELVEVHVADNVHLSDISGIAGNRRLERLTLTRCDVRHLDGVDQCWQLRVVNVDHNPRLTSLAGLAAAPQLQDVSAAHCDIRSLTEVDATRAAERAEENRATTPSPSTTPATFYDDEFNRGSTHERHAAWGKRGRSNTSRMSATGLCWPALRTLNVSHNPHLEQLHGLAGASGTLREIAATHCDLRSLTGLCRTHEHNYQGFHDSRNSVVSVTYRCLTHLTIDHNRSLEGCAELAVVAPRLTRLSVSGCNLRSVDGLGKCADLLDVTVSHNTSLESLDGFAGAPTLRRINAGYCGLRNLNSLMACAALAEVDVFRNAVLRSVAGLVGAAQLTMLDVRGCKVTDSHLLPQTVEILRGW